MKPALEVWKFGGASLADEHAIQRAAAQIAGHRGPLIVVASALAGVTDLLLSGAHAAVAGDPATATRASNTFRNKHHTVARAIASGRARERLIASIDEATREYANLCKALEMLGHLEPRAQDLLVSRGERISAALLAAGATGTATMNETVSGADNFIAMTLAIKPAAAGGSPSRNLLLMGVGT